MKTLRRRQHCPCRSPPTMHLPRLRAERQQLHRPQLSPRQRTQPPPPRHLRYTPARPPIGPQQGILACFCLPLWLAEGRAPHPLAHCCRRRRRLRCRQPPRRSLRTRRRLHRFAAGALRGDATQCTAAAAVAACSWTRNGNGTAAVGSASAGSIVRTGASGRAAGRATHCGNTACSGDACCYRDAAAGPTAAT